VDHETIGIHRVETARATFPSPTLKGMVLPSAMATIDATADAKAKPAVNLTILFEKVLCFRE